MFKSGSERRSRLNLIGYFSFLPLVAWMQYAMFNLAGAELAPWPQIAISMGCGVALAALLRRRRTGDVAASPAQAIPVSRTVPEQASRAA